MNEQQLIKKYSDFFDQKQIRKLILESIRLQQKYLILNFKEIELFDFEVSETLLDDFENQISLMNSTLESHLKNIYDVQKNFENVQIRLINFPESICKQICEIRAIDIDKLIAIKGYIKKISEILHMETKSTFECDVCGNTFTVSQNYEELVVPTTCNECGKKSKFKKINREICDLQKICVEEDTNDLIDVNSNPRRMLCILTNDLCRFEIDQTLQPSKKVYISGMIKDEPLKKGSKEFKKILLVHNISVCEDDSKKTFSEEEKIQILQISKTQTLLDDFKNSVFSTIYGNDDIKTALLLQMVSGNNFYDGKYLEERGVIHILLISSPGAGKTVLMRRAIRFVPGSIFTAGLGTSAAGICAAVVKDEEMGGFALESGVLPMCHEKIAYIDEIDKINKKDLAMMNNAMVDLQVRIDKASIHQTLKSNTAVCCAANPTNRVFDKTIPVWKQIGLQKDFLDRFDLIFPVDSITNEAAQRNVAKTVFNKIHNKHKKLQKYSDDVLIRYIAYARTHISPTIPYDVEEYLTDNYVNLVKPTNPNSGEEEAYFSTRLLTNLIRLTCAVAKLKLKEECDTDDARIAIDLLVSSLKKQDIVNNRGGLDSFKLEAVTPKNKRNQIFEIKQIIKELSKDQGFAAEIDIICRGLSKGITEEETLECIRKLAKEGSIYEPRRRTFALID